MKLPRLHKKSLVTAMLIIVVVFLVARRQSMPEVQVVIPASESVVEVLALSGTVKGVQESQISAEVNSNLEELLVSEGDQVAAGQALFRISSAISMEQLAQAEASVRVAEARLQQASRPPSESDRLQVEASTKRAVDDARAELRIAEQNLLTLQRGTRPEQLQQASADRLRTSSELKFADSELKRRQNLYQSGAISKSELERYENQQQAASGQATRASALYNELNNGARIEDRTQAELRVQQAMVRLRGASADRDAQLLRLAETPRIEDVRVAQAQLEEARRAFRVSQAKLEQTIIRAPYSGLVTKIHKRPGDAAGPNVPTLQLVSYPDLEVEVELEAFEISAVKVGQPAELRSEGRNDAPLKSKVARIGSRFDPERGTINVYLVPEDSNQLRPGETVDVNIIKSEATERPLLPLKAMRSVGRERKILVVEDGKIEEREVQVGALSPKGYPVLSELDPNTEVVMSSGEFQKGQRVRTVRLEL